MSTRTWLVSLSPEECRRRLDGSGLGRLAVVVDGCPEIFPVNYVFDPITESVAFPTNDGTKLHSSLSWPSVAFEIDGLDDDGGWSVSVVGRGIEIGDPEAIARLVALRTVLWRSESVLHWVRIEAERVTGRRIAAADS